MYYLIFRILSQKKHVIRKIANLMLTKTTVKSKMITCQFVIFFFILFILFHEFGNNFVENISKNNHKCTFWMTFLLNHCINLYDLTIYEKILDFDWNSTTVLFVFMFYLVDEVKKTLTIRILRFKKLTQLEIIGFAQSGTKF